MTFQVLRKNGTPNAAYTYAVEQCQVHHSWVAQPENEPCKVEDSRVEGWASQEVVRRQRRPPAE